MMNSLTVTTRDTDTDTDSLREDGQMPAVLYGRDTDSTPVQLRTAEFLKLWQEVGGSSIFKLEWDDDTKPALIQDVDLHPVTDQPIHADFLVLEEGQKVTVDVPVETAGTAPAVKNLGGLLVQVMRTVEIEADPENLPDVVEVDVTDLEEFGDQATVDDITSPDGVSILEDKKDVVVLIEEPEELEELEPEEDEEELDFEDIEVEGEKDEDELEGEGGEGESEGEEAAEGQEDRGQETGE
ncbi:MAG: 50S ribosomal protein L25 [Parcubacteria group bacterium SW_6_46_9]|nr:MAG: 50S ribosomal protein L25 [Parcubacteria group bacterium SW_6_46_9]